MPELPEVETIKRQLGNRLPGHALSGLNILDEKAGRYLKAGDIGRAVGQRVERVDRRAKVLLLHFDNGYVLAFHLKMTGQVILGNPNTGHLPDKHTRVILNFSGGTVIFFQDQRKFGWLKIIPAKALAQGLFKDRLGPEPFDTLFTVSYFQKELARSRLPVKLYLLDQRKIAGVGNIYANEALFLAKIHPTTVSRSLSNAQSRALHRRLLEVLEKGIRLGGASDNSYLNAFGEKGEYQNHFLVYRRQNQPCPVCGTPITRITLGGRGTYLCPKCQK